MPVSPQIGSEVGDDHEIEIQGIEPDLAARHVRAGKLRVVEEQRVQRVDAHARGTEIRSLRPSWDPPQATIAQMTTAAVASNAITTMAMSRAVLV